LPHDASTFSGANLPVRRVRLLQLADQVGDPAQRDAHARRPAVVAEQDQRLAAQE
jgi:hypothetical protein